jgi:hypothetical protein
MTMVGHSKVLIAHDRMLGKPTSSNIFLAKQYFFHAIMRKHSSKMLHWCPFSTTIGDALTILTTFTFENKNTKSK